MHEAFPDVQSLQAFSSLSSSNLSQVEKPKHLDWAPKWVKYLHPLRPWQRDRHSLGSSTLQEPTTLPRH